MKEGSGNRKDKTIPYMFVYHFQKKFKADSDKKISSRKKAYGANNRDEREISP